MSCCFASFVGKLQKVFGKVAGDQTQLGIFRVCARGV